MTNQETPESRKKRLAAARQARYVARKRAAGLVVGATVRRDLLNAVTPQMIRALDAGKALAPALTPQEIEVARLGLKVWKLIGELDLAQSELEAALRLGQQVQKILAKGGVTAFTLRQWLK